MACVYVSCIVCTSYSLSCRSYTYLSSLHTSDTSCKTSIRICVTISMSMSIGIGDVLLSFKKSLQSTTLTPTCNSWSSSTYTASSHGVSRIANRGQWSSGRGPKPTTRYLLLRLKFLWEICCCNPDQLAAVFLPLSLFDPSHLVSFSEPRRALYHCVFPRATFLSRRAGKPGRIEGRKDSLSSLPGLERIRDAGCVVLSAGNPSHTGNGAKQAPCLPSSGWMEICNDE